MTHFTDIRPLQGGLGVEIIGFTHEAIRRTEALAELKQILIEHSLVKISIENLSEEEQATIANGLGQIMDNRFGQHFKGGQVYVSNKRADGILGKGRIDFHHDHLYHKPTLRYLMLYGIEIPPSGSETHFRCGNSFLNALPAQLRKRAEAVQCLHLYDFKKIADREYRDWDDVAQATPEAPRAYKPFIWRNPDTGVEVLLLSQSTIDFRGIDREAGIRLYNELSDFATEHSEEIASYNHRWSPDDLVIWDNRMVAHARLPFDKEEPRTLRRTPVL